MIKSTDNITFKPKKKIGFTSYKKFISGLASSIFPSDSPLKVAIPSIRFNNDKYIGK